MKITIFYLLLVLISLPLLALSVETKVYIVYFGEHDGKKTLHEIENTHHSYLNSVKESHEDAKSSLLYSYKNSINGFAAKLTPDEASKLSKMKEVVSVIPSHGKYRSQTTRSWDFVGLNDHSWNRAQMGDDLLLNAQYGKNQIIGVVDSGVWPESASFSDVGMDPVPKTWKGICQEGVAFNKSHCNRKIIGARYYVKGFYNVFGAVNPSEDYLSPRDADGHGTHTASTATGRQVPNAAALGGIAIGIASGGAPMARLAIYKACWAMPGKPKSDGNTCMDEDVLAAIDDAIGDGVDILSLSLGFNEHSPLDQDVIAIGSLHAATKNILTVCSAGNGGPSPASLANIAPWEITVAASGIDRQFSSPVLLGNGMKIQGYSISPYAMSQMYPLVYARDVARLGVPQYLATQCQPDTLDSYKVNGRIVLCFIGQGRNVDKGIEVSKAGGVGLILANNQDNGNTIFYDSHFISATGVGYDGAVTILQYIYSTAYPTARILPVQSVSYTPAPFMAGYSSRGPNHVDAHILKPDITAPGLQILAAWSEASSPTKLPYDRRSTKFNLYSGTSMSCPHVSGVAALLRAVHPNWSLSAIKSALMTTASVTDNLNNPIQDYTGNPATPFVFGSGHFQPIKASDPGLVYDISYDDYLHYLCTINPGLLNKVNAKINCPNQLASPLNLNYPSFVIPNLYGPVTVTRRVTNVFDGQSRYEFSWNLPQGVSILVSPTVLVFDHVGQSFSFTMTIFPANDYSVRNQYVFGWYMWSDGRHLVRSPFAVFLP
ncbi:hypothetical protein E1A91_D10G037600v1 [Gossypium mustelinum]|uniref:Inhibitor I9 domain-containing protein n=1 Tax=Gossypium mustelinum TaxID=34275 RepID=A0A5D2T468_GOSMU|nr:hypothetical protein E1A91_D10G037600v1 [Gossypium mustelinum]